MSNEVEREAYHKWKSGAEPYGFNGFTAFQAGAEWQRTQAQPADALVEALEEVTASLEWNAHGICRGINDGPIMPSSMAVEFAIKALATYRAAQEKK